MELTKEQADLINSMSENFSGNNYDMLAGINPNYKAMQNLSVERVTQNAANIDAKRPLSERKMRTEFFFKYRTCHCCNSIPDTLGNPIQEKETHLGLSSNIFGFLLKNVTQHPQKN